MTSTQMASYLPIAAFFLLAAALYWLGGMHLRRKERKAIATLEDMAALGEVVPDTMHPVIDEARCIGSGGCVRACPEKDVLAIVKGRAVVLNPLACVGHSACLDACPVHAIRVVFGTATRGVELPKVDENFQTTRAGVYVIGELGGMGLIRNAVLQGKEAADHVIAGTRRGTGDVHDAVVVGAGPAGISAALRLMEAGLRVLVLEREAFGGTIVHYPRAKVVMTGVLELAVVGKVGKRRMSKEELVDVWRSIHDRTQLPVKVGVLVDGVEPTPDGAAWKLSTSAGPVLSANVLLALGRRGSPRKLDVPGEDQAKVHYRLLEPSEFRGKHVLVVGGGNSAVETAVSLAEAGNCASVTISYRRGAFARCRAENRRKMDEAIATGAVVALMNSDVTSIGERQVELAVRGGEKGKSLQKQIANDAVIIQAGGTAPAEILSKFGIDVETRYGQ